MYICVCGVALQNNGGALYMSGVALQNTGGALERTGGALPAGLFHFAPD